MASKRHKRRRSCESKIKHPTEAAAKQHAFRMKGCMPYKCKFCGGWHIGRPTKEKKQALAAKRKAAH